MGGRKTSKPPAPDPLPQTMPEIEMSDAERKVRKRRMGRASNILAGGLMSRQGKQLLGG